jgi:hypothetical protein
MKYMLFISFFMYNIYLMIEESSMINIKIDIYTELNKILIESCNDSIREMAKNRTMS